MAESIELRLSITSLKRVDPYVKDILATATHVALYIFNPSANEWERTGTIGALFLCRRIGEPWYSIMIMNRINPDNLIEPLLKEFEYQMQPPFLLYRNSTNKIFGVWFYNREECINVTYLLESLMESLKQKLSEKSKKKQGGDIFSMLSKAQQDFNNKTPTKREIPAQPQFSSTPCAPDIPSQSVMDFFAKASNTKPVKIIAPQAESANALQKLINNPLHSVEHIEKQQRSITPQDLNHTRSLFFPKDVTTDKDSELQNGLTFMEGCSPYNKQQGASPLTALLTQAHNFTSEEPDVSGTSPLANLIVTPHKPQLMPPNMFETKCLLKQKPEASETDKTVPLLTSTQLAQALIYLLNTDSDFVNKVHDAYKKSVNEKLMYCTVNSVK